MVILTMTICLYQSFSNTPVLAYIYMCPGKHDWDYKHSDRFI